MIVGTAGHIDHGKTSLVRALTGVETDRLKEEKARGISIDLGFAYLATEAGRIGFVDVPGHEKFVHNMLAGATGIDLVLLVVAADDGVMPQTREHLAIVDLLGARHALVALTKTDLVPPERVAAVTAEIAALLAGTGLAGAEILPVSNATGAGIDAVRAALVETAGGLARRRADGRFRLAVDRVFTLAGVGTVVTGTVASGAARLDDHVAVGTRALPARIRQIHAQNAVSEVARAGDRAALNLAGPDIAKEAIRRGDWVVDPALAAPTDRIDAELRVLASEARPLPQWMPVRFHHGAAELGARLVQLGEPPQPGGTARVQIVLEAPILAAQQDRFVLRDTSAARTIGGGTLLDLRAPARKRRTPERQAVLDALSEPEPSRALARLLDAPPRYVDLGAFARDRNLTEASVSALAREASLIEVAARGTTLAMAPATWAKLRRDIGARLADYHRDNPDLAGIGLERFRLSVEPRLPAPAFQSVLASLARLGEIAVEGAWVRLATHKVQLTVTDEKLWGQIAPRLEAEMRFRPPRVRDLATELSVGEADVRRLMKMLGRMGRLDEVAQDHFFLRETVAEIVAICRAISDAKDGAEFTAAELRDRLDNGRKVAIQILEFLDRHGVTIRRGDLRRMNKHRLDLFGAAEAGA